MSDLKIEYSPLRERINKLSELYSKLCGEIEKTAGYVEKLDIFWDGDANYAYITRIQKDMLEAGVLLMTIGDTVRLAEKVFEKYDENERTVQLIIGGRGK